jgi:hypothetical protein
MIKVEKILVKEFRGVRSLELDLGGKNFAICGPNGTGKSGIVDALDFALTGNISRLSGEGTGGLSVKEHGPHVDTRDPKLAVVELTVSIPSLGKTAKITRSVGDAKKPVIVPNDPDVKKILQDVAVHPEFVLSRRELIKYVLAEPAKRSQEVQALLRLNEVDHLRAMFAKIANAQKTQLRDATDKKKTAGDALIRVLQLQTLSTVAILEKVNNFRGILRLPAIESLEKDTLLNEGVTVGGDGSSSAVKIAKKAALADLDAFKSWVEYFRGDEYIQIVEAAKGELDLLKEDEAYLGDSSKAAFLEKALADYDGEHCPVCDTSFSPEDFGEIIRGKLSKFESVIARRKVLEEKIRPLVEVLNSFKSCMEIAVRMGSALQSPIDASRTRHFAKRLGDSEEALRRVLPLSESVTALDAVGVVPAEVLAEFEDVQKSVRELPEADAQEGARINLMLAQERFADFQKCARNFQSAEQDSKTAQKISDAYGRVTTGALEAIYKNVEGSFRELYRLVNSDDESKFEAKLQPTLNKLGFEVDFYGRGYFPPSAYHSEGHQDGMGLCLYLALMKHLAGDAFTFAVLDDVLMSVDSGHRREVSQMLKSQFPLTQFIFTTHDEIWLKHMKTVGLIEPKRNAHFRSWNVDVGPADWNDRDVWTEIDSHLQKNNVREAAALLRHFLEYFAKEVCHGLRAPVVFSGDAQYTLNDLLPSGVAKFKKHLGAAKAAAQSWGREIPQDLTDLEKKLSDASRVSQVEQWQVNSAVHYNEWANLHKNDFSPVVSAFKELVESFYCSACNGVVYATPAHNPEALRCMCGSINFSLIKK